MDTPRLTREQALIVTMATGVFIADLDDVYCEMEKVAGRPVMTHDLISSELWAKAKAEWQPKLAAILPERD